MIQSLWYQTLGDADREGRVQMRNDDRSWRNSRECLYRVRTCKFCNIASDTGAQCPRRYDVKMGNCKF